MLIGDFEGISTIDQVSALINGFRCLASVKTVTTSVLAKALHGTAIFISYGESGGYFGFSATICLFSAGAISW